MNILVLHGPNLNLIGLRAAKIGERVTLDKIDTALKRKAKELQIVLKTLQTHHSGKAIVFLQRNRNWADGLIFAPGAWAKYAYDIKDTLKLIHIPFGEVFFSENFDPENYKDSSIFSEIVQSTHTGEPGSTYLTALEHLYQFLKEIPK